MLYRVHCWRSENDITQSQFIIFTQTIMHLVCSSNFFVFNFSCDDCNTQEKFKTMILHFFWKGGWVVVVVVRGGGVKKVHYVICENGESLLIHLHKLL